MFNPKPKLFVLIASVSSILIAAAVLATRNNRVPLPRQPIEQQPLPADASGFRLLTTQRKFLTGKFVDGNLTTKEGVCEVYLDILGESTPHEMVVLPGGQFQMGQDASQSVEFENECNRFVDKAICKQVTISMTPQHKVAVSPFMIGRYEVTQRQWKSVTGALPPGMRNEDPKFVGDDLPVIRVSWNDIREFLAKLGNVYRLPTEAEWEYAARAGTETRFAFGNEITPQIANFNGIWPIGSQPVSINRQTIVAVGSLGLANPWGIYDMHGNVWEWCEDDWHDTYNGAPTTGIAWKDQPQSAVRVIRGSSWIYGAAASSSAMREWRSTEGSFLGVGFRLARSLP